MGASQDQTITVHYVATQAQKDAAKFATDEQRRTKETADAAAKAASETAAAQTKAAKDATAAREKASKDAIAAQVRATKDADLAEAAKARALKSRTKLESDVNALLASHAADEVTQAQKTAAARVAARRESVAKEMALLREQHKTAMAGWALEQKARAEQRQGLRQQIKALEEEEKAAGGAQAAVMGFMGAYATIGTVVAAVRAINDYMAQLQMDTFEAARNVTVFREEVLELAAMRGHLGDTTPETIEQLKFRGQTIQTRQAALEMSTAAEGAGQAAIGKNISREAFDAGKVAMGQLQAMEGSAPKGYGALLGTLALEAKNPTKDEMKGEINRQFEISKPGTFVDMAQFAQQRQQLTSYVQTGAISGPQASALLSALSLEVGPEKAATQAEQILASTTSDFMRAKGMKTLPGQEHETSAAYFQEHLGLKPGIGTQAKLDAVVADLLKEEKASQARGENFDAYEYLGEHGLANQEARRGYASMMAVHKQGQWEQFQKLVDQKTDPDVIARAHAERVGRDEVMQKRSSAIVQDASKITRAVGDPTAELNESRQAAFAAVSAHPEHGHDRLTGTYEEWLRVRSGPVSRAFEDRLFNDYNAQVDFKVLDSYVKEAKRIGLPVRTPEQEASPEFVDLSEEKNLMLLKQRIQKAGGDPMRYLREQSTGRAVDALEKNAATINADTDKGKAIDFVAPPGVAAPPKDGTAGGAPAGGGGDPKTDALERNTAATEKLTEAMAGKGGAARPDGGKPAPPAKPLMPAPPPRN